MLNYKKLFTWLRSYRFIVNSLYSVFVGFFKKLSYTYSDLMFSLRLRFIFKCPLAYLKENYKHIGKFHLEIKTNNGIFINKCHRLLDIFPIILVIEKDRNAYLAMQTKLEGTLCYPELVEVDIINDIFETETKFNSISLYFFLEELASLSEIESLIIKLKSLLSSQGIIIGSTILGEKHPLHTKKALEIIKNQNSAKIWYNLNYSYEDLESILNKNFDNVTLTIRGSCLMFRLDNLNPDLIKEKMRREARKPREPNVFVKI